MMKTIEFNLPPDSSKESIDAFISLLAWNEFFVRLIKNWRTGRDGQCMCRYSVEIQLKPKEDGRKR